MARKVIYAITTFKSFKRALGHLTTLKRTIATRVEHHNQLVVALNEQADKDLKPDIKEYEATLEAVWKFVLDNLTTLFGKRKEVEFPGVVLVRTPSTALEILDEELLIKALKELGADFVIQRKETVSLATLKSHPEIVKRLKEKYPGTVEEKEYLNFRINHRPRGKRNRLSIGLTSETLRVPLPDSD